MYYYVWNNETFYFSMFDATFQELHISSSIVRTKKDEEVFIRVFAALETLNLFLSCAFALHRSHMKQEEVW